MTYRDLKGTFFDNIYSQATLFGQSFLRVAGNALSAELQQELSSPAPQNNNFCEIALIRWLERLKIIESVFNNFPPVITRT